MSKKDYELIAGAIRVSLDRHRVRLSDLNTMRVVSDLVETLCNELGQENDKFNEVRFMDACNVWAPLK